jgi:hypothetical protein
VLECLRPSGRADLFGFGRIEHLGRRWLPSSACLGIRGRREQVPWPSSLARGAYGWAEVATFLITGLLIVTLAIAVRDQLPRRRASSFAVALVGSLGVALILAAFRVDVPMLSGGSPATWHGWVHGIAFLLIIAMGLLAPLTMALAVRGDPDWRPIAVVSVAAKALFVVFLFLPVGQRLIPDGDRHCLRLDHSGCRTPSDPYLLNQPVLLVAAEDTL